MCLPFPFGTDDFLGKLTTKFKKLKSSTTATTIANKDANTNHFDTNTADDDNKNKKMTPEDGKKETKKATLTTANGEKVKLPPIRSTSSPSSAKPTKTVAKVAESNTAAAKETSATNKSKTKIEPTPQTKNKSNKQAKEPTPEDKVKTTSSTKRKTGVSDTDVNDKKKIASKLPPLRKWTRFETMLYVSLARSFLITPPF